MKGKKADISLFSLFITFFMIGAFSFGGGYAMLPVIEREISEKHKWVPKNELQDVFAITGCLPGAIALNTAAFTGYITRGIWGMVVAVCGNLLPSSIIVLFFCLVVSVVRDNSLVETAFFGIRPVVVALILYAAIKMAKESLCDNSARFLCLIAVFVAFVFPSMGMVPIILGGGCFGIILQNWKQINKKGNRT